MIKYLNTFIRKRKGQMTVSLISGEFDKLPEVFLRKWEIDEVSKGGLEKKEDV